jgi:hypothetical protein
MSFPAHYVGTYTGTGAALEVLDAGFKPSFLRIYNDSDNDVIFDYFQGQSSGIAVKQGAGAFVPAALTLVGSTPAFTGSAPYAANTLAITDQDTPDGNPIYVKLTDDGQAYLACNIAADTVDKAVALSGGGKVIVKHDASAASGGYQLYCDDDAAATARLQINNSLLALDVFIKSSCGRLIKITHSATAAADGVALNYDDGADDRIEGELAGNASITATSEVQGWKSVTPAGSNAQVTVTGDSAGSVSTSVSEVSSQGITLQDRGFSLGTDSSINESGKVYRYIALR